MQKYICKYTHTTVYVYRHTPTHIYIDVGIYIHACLCVCMRARVYFNTFSSLHIAIARINHILCALLHRTKTQLISSTNVTRSHDILSPATLISTTTGIMPSHPSTQYPRKTHAMYTTAVSHPHIVSPFLLNIAQQFFLLRNCNVQYISDTPFQTSHLFYLIIMGIN